MYEAAKEDGGREKGRDGWTFSDFMNNNGEDCVLIQSTKLTNRDIGVQALCDCQ
jgi:hypothetical protein